MCECSHIQTYTQGKFDVAYYESMMDFRGVTLTCDHVHFLRLVFRCEVFSDEVPKSTEVTPSYGVGNK